MKILFLGDIVGRAGRQAVTDHLPGLVERHGFDFVAINGENAAGGFGITEEIFQAVIDAGADCVTTGNHVWDQKEALVFAERQDRFLRPINFPPATPGRGANLFVARNGAQVLVINVMGQVFMHGMDDPFAAMERQLESCRLGHDCDAILVDMHAEATSEKQVMGNFLDGQATLVVGTHTHVPTADHRILPGGTAYVTDIGMCGDYDSIIGMDKEEPIRRMTTKISSARMTPALGEGSLSGVVVETDEATGLARNIEALRIGPHLENTEPEPGA
jgi:metallophosphoesterase (TIGR00282 family)